MLSWQPGVTLIYVFIKSHDYQLHFYSHLQLLQRRIDFRRHNLTSVDVRL